jgi:hypothetical protein
LGASIKHPNQQRKQPPFESITSVGFTADQRSAQLCTPAIATVPLEFPSIGGSCGTHLVFRSSSATTFDATSTRGAAPLTDLTLHLIRFDSQARAGEPPPPLARVELLVSSLGKGKYTQSACNQVLVGDADGTNVASSWAGPGESVVTIVGNDGQNLWGTVTAKVCAVTGSRVVNGQVVKVFGCTTFEGRFAAKVESTPTTSPWAPPPGGPCGGQRPDGGLAADSGLPPPPPPLDGRPPPLLDSSLPPPPPPP